MKIELTEKEYRDLLDILHVADAVMSGHRRTEDIRSTQHRALIQKLYALAREEGLERLIGVNETSHIYSPSSEFEENSMAHVLINEFADHLFWDELINRLSIRDAALMAGGINGLNALSDNDRQMTEGTIRHRYVEEFSRHGITNLEVVERPDMYEEGPVKTSD